MKKEEILALGVPEEKIREFQELYNRDLDNRLRHPKDSGIRAAIASMLPMIQQEENLRKILKSVTHFYIAENSQPKPEQEAQG